MHSSKLNEDFEFKKNGSCVFKKCSYTKSEINLLKKVDDEGIVAIHKIKGLLESELIAVNCKDERFKEHKSIKSPKFKKWDAKKHRYVY